MTTTEWAGGDPTVAVAELRWILEQAISGSARTMQTAIGPSELGTPCDWCLGHKLAGIPELRDLAWLPTIGTAVHGWAEQVVNAFNVQLIEAGGDGRFLTEGRVHVGDVDGTQVWGTSDVFDVVTGTVIDYKITGTTTLRTARSKGPSLTYQRQAHLYGRGWAALGFTVSNVAIWYLPRNDVSLDRAVLWTTAYDEQVALDTLARADALARAIRLAGPDVVLPQLARAPDCFSCPRYPAEDGSAPLPPGRSTPKSLTALLAG
jgi:hypothetical protein